MKGDDKMHIINIATAFSSKPGARFKTDGEFSGEQFREEFLVPLFKDSSDNSKIQIILDGLYGHPTSFLDEAFGGLARDYGKERCLERFEFISSDTPLLREEIQNYIKNCDEKK